MTVWVLMEGDRSEGGSVLGVFAEPSAAKAYAESGSHYCEWSEWRGDDEMYTRADDGCDWQQITRHEVVS